MASLTLQDTQFEFSILQTDKEKFWANTKISIKNEYVRYENRGADITREELENFLFSMHRLLAGAYAKEYSLSFEKAGIAVDLYATTKGGKELSREERRKENCAMVFRLLMKTSDGCNFLGGVYSFILHRTEIEKLASALLMEYRAVFGKEQSEGKYLFVGVSPKGYVGCNYWYLDETKSVKAGEYVWVRMGRHNIEQVVYVDNVRFFDEENAPYPPDRVKKVLKKAIKEEIAEAKSAWERGSVD